MYQAMAITDPQVVSLPYVLGDDEVELQGLAQVTRSAPGDGSCLRFSIGTSLAVMGKKTIFATLEHCRGNKRRAAEVLGVSLKTLYNRLAEYAADQAPAADMAPAADTAPAVDMVPQTTAVPR